MPVPVAMWQLGNEPARIATSDVAVWLSNRWGTLPTSSRGGKQIQRVLRAKPNRRDQPGGSPPAWESLSRPRSRLHRHCGSPVPARPSLTDKARILPNHPRRSNSLHPGAYSKNGARRSCCHRWAGNSPATSPRRRRAGWFPTPCRREKCSAHRARHQRHSRSTNPKRDPVTGVVRQPAPCCSCRR